MEQTLFSLFIIAIVAGITAYLARERGRDPLTWFIVGLLFSIFGMLLLLLLPPVRVQKAEPEERREPQPEFLTKEWFFLDGSWKSQGPFSFDEIRRRWREGKVSSDTPVWFEGADDWCRLSEIPRLMESLERSGRQSY